MTHYLKIWKEYFEAVDNESKRFEYRKNDRNFNIGDRLVLCEYDPITRKYSGRKLRVEVLYILYVGEYAILSIRREYRDDDASENG